jgi:hypothetical protein
MENVMTRSVFATVAAVLASVSLATTQGSAGNAQATKKMSATGIVTSVSSASLVIEGNEKQSITFAVDSTTRLLARGRIVKIRPHPAIGAPGLKITDVLHLGDLVTVSFYLTGPLLRASEVRVIREFRR